MLAVQSKGMEQTTILTDHQNPQFLFSTVDTTLLLKIVSGEINANEAAAKELANRGLDHSGIWIGFKK